MLAWELGNELTDPSQTDVAARPPAAWSEEMAAHVRALSRPRQAVVLDGGLFEESALELRGVDLVGSTFYNLPSDVLAGQLRAVAAHNAARNASHGGTGAKGFVVREYGLVSARPEGRVLTVEQNASWIEAMVGACAAMRDACLGTLVWSLRFRADEGGFHWHAEEGGDILGLHWCAPSTPPLRAQHGR